MLPRVGSPTPRARVPSMIGKLWDRHVLPHLVRKACSSGSVSKRRALVVPRAHGRVLEIGIGAGYNLDFYDPDKVESVLGVDPTEELIEEARATSRGLPFPVDILAQSAESRLPVETGSIDTVVVTWTLCTIPDVAAALAEMKRTLSPDGSLLFCEHALAPEREVQRVQNAINPVWKRVGGGCNINRPIEALITDAGFAIEELDAHYLKGPRWLNYTVRGVAKPKPG